METLRASRSTHIPARCVRGSGGEAAFARENDPGPAFSWRRSPALLRQALLTNSFLVLLNSEPNFMCGGQWGSRAHLTPALADTPRGGPAQSTPAHALWQGLGIHQSESGPNNSKTDRVMNGGLVPPFLHRRSQTPPGWACTLNLSLNPCLLAGAELTSLLTSRPSPSARRTPHALA